MPKKHRRGKAKFKARGKFKPLVAAKVSQRPEALPISSTQVTTTKQMSAAKPLATMAEMATRYRYVLTELKYIGIIAGAMFLLLVILSFFIH